MLQHGVMALGVVVLQQRAALRPHELRQAQVLTRHQGLQLCGRQRRHRMHCWLYHLFGGERGVSGHEED